MNAGLLNVNTGKLRICGDPRHCMRAESSGHGAYHACPWHPASVIGPMLPRRITYRTSRYCFLDLSGMPVVPVAVWVSFESSEEIFERRVELGVDTADHVAGHILHVDVRIDAVPLNQPLAVHSVRRELWRRGNTTVHQCLVRLNTHCPAPGSLAST